MNLDLFLDPEHENYQVEVIAPTHTYGTVYSFDSRYAFEVDSDEYDTIGEWEYLVVVNGETIASFNTLDETRRFIVNTDFDFY